MKKILILSLLFCINSCNSQIKKTITNNKPNTMEYFNINNYKNWEEDTERTSSEKDKYLKFKEKRVSIEYFNNVVRVEESNISSPYLFFKVFYTSNNSLKLNGQTFYTVDYGIWRSHDEKGKLIKVDDLDKSYKFSLENLINKMKEEYNLDLMNKSSTVSISRYEEKKDLHVTLYEIWYRDRENRQLIHCYLISGTTGKTIFTNTRYLGDKKGSLLQNYLDSLKTKNSKSSERFW